MELVQELSLLNTYPLRHFRWPNGFQAILVHNPIAPVAAYLSHYTVGSALEHEDQRGLAHFFEHMMFRETARLRDGDFDRIISELGGVGLNAFTSYDTTAYHVNVPAWGLERLIEMEADRMVNLRLSPDLIEKERGAVLGEMHMYADMPSEQHWNALMAAAFPAHPYRHPIIGYPEQVAAFDDDSFRRFYAEHYAPNRALVVVAGGYDEPALLATLDRCYGPLPRGHERPAPRPPDAPPAASHTLEVFHDKITSDYLSMATRTPGLHHPDQAALNLLSSLLSNGQSSPLHRAIVLEGIGTGVYTTVMDAEYMLSSPGLFLIDVTLQHGVPAETAVEAVDAELRALLRDGISDGDLERALNQFRLGTYASMRTNMSLARQVGGYMVAGEDPLFIEHMLAAVRQVSREQLAAALETYLVRAPRLTVIQRPQQPERPA